MTIRATPPISLSDVMAELRITNSGRQFPISLGDADVRALAGKPSGAISLSDLYSRSSYIPMTVYATGNSEFVNTGFQSGTLESYAAASVSGGKGTKFFNWVVLETIGAPTVSGHSTSTLTVRVDYVRYSNGHALVRARCDVTDETGAVVSSPEVIVELDWESAV